MHYLIAHELAHQFTSEERRLTSSIIIATDTSAAFWYHKVEFSDHLAAIFQPKMALKMWLPEYESS
jgi:hypothetical protein